MNDNERLLEDRANSAAASLRWTASHFIAPEKSDDFAGQLTRCIHDYCIRTADTIDELILALDRQSMEEAIK